MPEAPDLEVYREAMVARIRDSTLTGIRSASPFVLRTAEPPVAALQGLTVLDVTRLAKRLVISLSNNHLILIHLMIAGRLRWLSPGARIPGRNGIMAFDFESGTLLLTEASKKRRAAVHLLASSQQLAEFDPGGLDVLQLSSEEFMERLIRTNHTLKRALTDQHIFSGIGNAYSDEILFAAGLSPLRQTRFLTEEDGVRLWHACRDTLRQWTERLRDQAGGEFPGKVTAFQPMMQVHGKYKQPCTVCQHPIQRIRYASNESNYCAACQNQGNILADRSLSRLLKKDWPRTLEELETVQPHTLPT